MTQAERNIAINIWTARAIPIVLAGIVGYTTYVVVALLCVNYLLARHADPTAAIPILVFYFILLLMMAISFLRLLYITVYEPPYVPLGAAAARDRARKHKKRHSEKDEIGSREYNAFGRTDEPSSQEDNLQSNVDSPGLELFYTRDVFVCETDGKPKWCSTCGNWKPDRAHHCSSSGRCILKMDHFCPWVGGPIGENNFKFFIQFTGWTALYCTHVLVIMAIYIKRQQTNPLESINSQFIATLALAGFFGLFTAGMTGTSVDLAVRNQTQVERLSANTRLHILAILKPAFGGPDMGNMSTNFEPYAEITYPLDSGSPPSQDRWQTSQLIPSIKTNTHIQQPDPVHVPHQSPVDRPNGSKDTPYQSSEHIPPSKEIDNASGNTGNEIHHTSESSLPTRDFASGSTVVTNLAPMKNHASQSHGQSAWPNGSVEARDRKATRTFAVLRMLEPGNNPWDLGSALLNWQSLMGDSVLDWFLPIHRSPCSNHDDFESYYSIGPSVDSLREKYALTSPARASVGSERKRRKHRSSHRTADNSGQSSKTERHERHRRRKKQRHQVEEQQEPEAAVALRDLNEQARAR